MYPFFRKRYILFFLNTALVLSGNSVFEKKGLYGNTNLKKICKRISKLEKASFF